GTGAGQHKHKARAPVTLAQPKGIYVHAKIMIIDDVMVSIGSSNLNRRGLFHDGEMVSFTIPAALLAADDNPARALRTKLWAEHLGLPPSMGSSLFGDYLSGFELFKRSYFVGNRFTSVDMMQAKPFMTSASLSGTTSDSALSVIFKALAFAV